MALKRQTAKSTPTVNGGIFSSRDDLNDRLYMSTVFNAYFGLLMPGSDGVYGTIEDGFAISVSERGHSVVVGTGRAYISGHWVEVDTPQTFNCPLNNSGKERIDAITLRYSEEGRDVDYEYFVGTPADDPTPPDVGPDHLLLHLVHIRPNAEHILKSDIDPIIGTGTTPYILGMLQKADYDAKTSTWKKLYYDWFTYLVSRLQGDIYADFVEEINRFVPVVDQLYSSHTEMVNYISNLIDTHWFTKIYTVAGEYSLEVPENAYCEIYAAGGCGGGGGGGAGGSGRGGYSNFAGIGGGGSSDYGLLLGASITGQVTAQSNNVYPPDIPVVYTASGGAGAPGGAGGGGGDSGHPGKLSVWASKKYSTTKKTTFFIVVGKGGERGFRGNRPSPTILYAGTNGSAGGDSVVKVGSTQLCFSAGGVGGHGAPCGENAAQNFPTITDSFKKYRAGTTATVNGTNVTAPKPGSRVSMNYYIVGKGGSTGYYPGSSGKLGTMAVNAGDGKLVSFYQGETTSSTENSDKEYPPARYITTQTKYYVKEDAPGGVGGLGGTGGDGGAGGATAWGSVSTHPDSSKFRSLSLRGGNGGAGGAGGRGGDGPIGGYGYGIIKKPNDRTTQRFWLAYTTVENWKQGTGTVGDRNWYLMGTSRKWSTHTNTTTIPGDPTYQPITVLPEGATDAVTTPPNGAVMGLDGEYGAHGTAGSDGIVTFAIKLSNPFKKT